MKTIKIPQFLHEVLVKESTPAELVMILITSILGTLSLFYFTNTEWNQLGFWKTLIPATNLKQVGRVSSN